MEQLSEGVTMLLYEGHTRAVRKIAKHNEKITGKVVFQLECWELSLSFLHSVL